MAWRTGGCRVRASRVAVVLATTALILLLAAGVEAVPASAEVGAANIAHPVVVSVDATPQDVPAAGATVEVTGAIDHAQLCQLRLESDQSFPVVYSHNAKACTGGTFSARVTVGPNPPGVVRTIAFVLVARGEGSTADRLFRIRLAALPAATVLKAQAAPAELPASGASFTITGVVAHAASCQLELLSRQSFAVVYSHNAKSCRGGAYSARVTVGPNTTGVPRTVAFALVARNAAFASTSRLYVVLAPASKPATTPVPPTTTTVPPAANSPAPTVTPEGPPSVPVSDDESTNWSGYAAVGGPYTLATGTFTTPSLVSGTSGVSNVSEWVGLDGLGQGDSDLIQAGVDDVPDASSATGFDVQAWWEILPAAQTNITSMTVQPGDKVTVTIWKVSGSTWEIEVADDTSGQSFTSPPQQYSGAGSSVDWVVEAATQCEISCHVSQAAPYSPPVVFSALGMSGPENTGLDEVTMVQGGQSVSTPSALAADGFTVTYTGS